MKSIHRAAIIATLSIGVALVAATYVVVYTHLTYPRSYGIADIEFISTRLWPMIKIVFENNKNVSITVVAVLVNGSEVSNNSGIYPYIYPELPVTIQPNTRTTLTIENISWKWSTLETKYTYSVTLVAGDSTVFTKIKETPSLPL